MGEQISRPFREGVGERPTTTKPRPHRGNEVTDETTAILNRARGFIERGWCRDSLARDAAGRWVTPTSHDAVEWHAVGALFAAGIPARTWLLHPAVRELQHVLGGEGIGAFNNRQETVEPVLAAFDRAIASTGKSWMAISTCSHGKSLCVPYGACEKIWGADDRRRLREDKMREALVNARSFVSLFHDAPARTCLEQIDEALYASHGTET